MNNKFERAINSIAEKLSKTKVDYLEDMTTIIKEFERCEVALNKACEQLTHIDCIKYCPFVKDEFCNGECEHAEKWKEFFLR